MADDLIRDLVRRVLDMRPEMKLDDLLRLELALRAEFGGRDYYVKKRATAEPGKPKA